MENDIYRLKRLIKKENIPFIFEAFKTLAKKMPNVIAIEDSTRQYSYAKLLAVTRNIAILLKHKNLRKGQVIAIYGDSSFLQIACILACWQCGAVILLLDPALPEQRIRIMLQESKAKFLCFEEKYLINVNFLAKDNLQKLLITEEPALPKNKKIRSLPLIKKDHPAYIFFVSGSMGVPKGVMGTHSGLSHFLHWQKNEFMIQPGDRCALLTSVSFDVILSVVFTPLMSGASVSIPKDNNFSSYNILHWLQKKQITMLHLVPTLAQLLLINEQHIVLSHLKKIFFSGEKLYETLVTKWRSMLPADAEIINLYGATETTLAKFYYRIPGSPLKGTQPVGRPLPQTELYLVNENGELVDRGKVGEIVIRTPYCTLGYINSAEDTNQSFKVNPYRRDNNDYLYFTGDIGKINQSGQLEIIGRKDQQFKFNGIRIEAGEIETILTNERDILQAAVTKELYHHHEVLVAYVKLAKPLSVADIVSHLAYHLPRYILPNLFIEVEEIPYTLSNKLDLKRLSLKSGKILRANTVSLENLTDTELKISEIWQKILGIKDTALNESFLTIGGDSLQAMRIINAIHQYFKVDLPMTLMLSQPTITQMACNIDKLLGDQNKKLEQIPLPQAPVLSKKELNNILTKNNNPKTFKESTKIQYIIENQCQLTPKTIALAYEDSTLTYGELNDRSNAFASILAVKIRSLKLERQDNFIVGICLPRGINLIVGMLATLKIGAAHLLLEPSFPANRLAYIIEDSKMQLILTSKKVMTDNSLQSIFFDKNVLYLEDLDCAKIDNDIKPLINQEAQYIIYTSGSTGQPKGVVISHAACINMINSMNEILNIKQYQRALQFCSITFDVCIFEIYSALCNGLTLTIASEIQRKNPESLINLIRDKKIQLLNLPPAILTILPRVALPDLKAIIVAGEACDANTFNKWSQNFCIYNAYGPAEVTVFSTIHHYRQGDDASNIGKPLHNNTIYVLDENLHLVPIGATGELYLGGAGLGLGYLNRPDLNEEKFIINPYNIKEKLYKTGDLVKWTEDWDLIFLGRKDFQIKFNGYRIETFEIEAAINAIDDIKQSAVVLRTDNNVKHLVAYCVKSNDSLSEKQLRVQLANILPSYMMPTLFVFLDYLPLNYSGKIDRRNLPKPEIRVLTKKDHPVTKLENDLAMIWSELLKVPKNQIGLDDNFFDLGGHSILLAQMILLLKETLSIKLDYVSFIDNPVIRSIANRVASNDDFYAESKSIKQAIIDTKFNHLEKVNHAGTLYVTQPKEILLTGASGFLGNYLLRDLLQHTHANIYCLVRDKHKLLTHIKRLNINHFLKTRIFILEGDLAQDNFGLPSAFMLELSNKIDTIFHCGAVVNHVLSYLQLRTANTLATKNLLHFAMQNNIKTMHYISTVDAANIFDEHGYATETYASSLPLDNISGYALSKWASERLIKQAMDAGLPAVIYRPGNITADSKTGYNLPESNHLLLLISGCLALGYAPDWNLSIEMTPVDVVSLSIVKLSLQGNSNQCVYHLSNPLTIKWSDYINQFLDGAYTIEFIPFASWQRDYLSHIDETNPLFPLKILYSGTPIDIVRNYSSTKTQERLKNLGIVYPNNYAALMRVYRHYLIKHTHFYRKATFYRTA